MAKFYAVGIGMGGEYMTLGALRTLEKADIIAVPVKRHGEKSTALEMVKKEFAIHNKEICEQEFPMTRDSAVLEQARQAAAEKIISYLKDGKTVSMITLGAVSIYSTASYIREQIKSAGYSTETVAGVPSFIAAADKAQISLCEGNEAVAFVPSADLEKIEKYIDDFDTVVIMKAGKNINALHSLLKKHNLHENAIVCADIGMESERVEPLCENKSCGYFTTVIVKKNIDKFHGK